MTNANAKSQPLTLSYFFRPGRIWTDDQRARYHSELMDIASDCFLEVPMYQALTGEREELGRSVITLARNAQGRAVAFCAAVILSIDGFGDVLHLGLTCVRKEARGRGLTHRLTSRLIMRYLLRTSPVRRIWITNVACVISSLGNVSLHFENVFPSPYGKKRPGRKHIAIAAEVDREFREPLAISSSAVFEADTFVFRGSVNGTVFQKSGRDTRYHHRKPDLNLFYSSLMDFKAGDEVLQVGQVGLLSYPRYRFRLILAAMKRIFRVPLPVENQNPFSGSI